LGEASTICIRPIILVGVMKLSEEEWDKSGEGNRFFWKALLGEVNWILKYNIRIIITQK
jgi:hypothetical protein